MVSYIIVFFLGIDNVIYNDDFKIDMDAAAKKVISSSLSLRKSESYTS